MEFDPNWILFHGHGLLVVDKPAGVPLHSGTGHDEGLVELIDAWVRLHPGTLDIRAGKSVVPAHSLDVGASGVTLLALRRQIARDLADAVSASTLRFQYWAVVSGPLPETGSIRGKVNSRAGPQTKSVEASLRFRRMCGDERLSLAEVFVNKIQRHAVRSLFASHGRALAGDSRYGKPKPSRQFLTKFALEHYLLHAAQVELPKEILGSPRTLQAPPPADFIRLADQKAWGDVPEFGQFTEPAEDGPAEGEPTEVGPESEPE